MRRAIEMIRSAGVGSFRVRNLVVVATAIVILAPRPARAEAYVNPWAGVIFGNDEASKGLRSFGAAIGDAGGSVWGTETNIAISPAFFGSGVENYVLDFTAGVTIGPTFNPRSRRPVRPYTIVEVGVIRTSIDAAPPVGKFSRNDFGYCLGAGLSIGLSDQFGIRGDVRYFRTFSGDDALNSLNVHLDDFNYWRAQFGITLR